MAEASAANLRRLWLKLHRWIGIGLALLLVPISLSGALLVWHEPLDALINPHRYAVSGAQVRLAPSAYLDSAARAVGDRFAPALVRFPERDGAPLIVSARGREAADRRRRLDVYLDPPTARALDVVDFRSTFFGLMHRLHENLTIPQYSGRAIVGWIGVGMLIMSLTGIWLWWPRNAGFARGLRWARSPRFTFNLHNMLGFWISVPLAVVSLTGIYLGFPQTARGIMAAVAEVSPRGPRGFSSDIAQHTAMTADRAMGLARQAAPDALPLMLFLPTQSRGERARRSADSAGARWRAQMTRSDGGTVTVVIDDRSGRANLAPAPAGDRAASWIRWIHEGSHSGPIWRVIVFLTGAFPTAFVVTGLVMWWRGRASRKLLAGPRPDGQLRAAE